MPKLIEGTFATGGRIVDDAYVPVDTGDALATVAADASVLVPLAVFEAHADLLLARKAPLGVRLEGDDDPEVLVDDLDAIALIAIDFPKFTDGRGYSIAVLLRERYGYRGTLRAVGDVLRDQLFYMLRCGFDSFAMKHQDRIDEGLSAYHDFDEAYQASVERPLPLFRRRAHASAPGRGLP